MMDNLEVFDELREKISFYTGHSLSDITLNTRLYHDAGMSGEDYCNFIDWFSGRYGVDFEGFHLPDFSPAEGPFDFRSLFRPTYFQLSVGDLLELTNFSSWRKSGLTSRLKRA